MDTNNKQVSSELDKLFRQCYGKLVSMLLSKYGTSQLELIENAIMESYYKAMKTWPFRGMPEKSHAWLYKTANNSLIDSLRREKRVSPEQFDFTSLRDTEIEVDEVKDPELKLLFLICNPDLKKEDQLVFMLKTLSGFGDLEISNALMQSKAAIKKRLLRAKSWIKSNDIKFDWPSDEDLKVRVTMVNRVLYLLFNEGFYSSHPEYWVRKDLCVEAMRLCKYLVDHDLSNYETKALMSLMCYHISRYESRIDDNGHIILLQDQDRSSWNQDMIKLGNYYLQQSARNTTKKSSYQIEAFISAQHCIAKDFASTNWKILKELYQVLYNKGKQNIVLLNLILVKLNLNETKEAKRLFESIDISKLKSIHTTYYMVGMKLYESLKDQMQIELMLEQAIQSSEGKKESIYLKSKLDSIRKS